MSKEEASATFDNEEIDPILDEFRAGLARNNEIRETSGCEALWREHEKVTDQIVEIENRIAATPAISLAGLIAQLEFLRETPEDSLEDFDVIIEGVKTVVSAQQS